MWNIMYIIKDYLHTKNFQEFINRRFNDKNKQVVSNKVFKTISDGEISYYLDDMSHTIEEAYIDYDFTDLRSSDTVLDIGACIGGFSLKTAKKVKHVYAVEPIKAPELRRNIELNNMQNITVIEGALGEEVLNVKWGGVERSITGMNLSEIIEKCGGHVDFLKMDCEGGEWCIKPEELNGIRRIEAEIHNLDGKHNFNTFLEMLGRLDYKYTYTSFYKYAMLVHAYKNNM